MSIDQRTRKLKDVAPLTVEQVVDEVLPEALRNHGDLAQCIMLGPLTEGVAKML